MNWIIIAVIILAVAVIVISKLKKGDTSCTVNYPYQSSGALFTPAERSFYGVLEQSAD